MKQILFFTVILLSSCAHNRIKFVKQSKQGIVKVNSTDSKSADIEELQESNNSYLAQSITQDEKVKEDLEDLEGENLNSSNSIRPQPTDSTKQQTIEVDTEKLNKDQLAQIAQEEALRARKLMLGSLLSWIGLLLGGFGLIVSIILFIMGSVALNRANSSPYITSVGLEDARKAKVMKTIWIVGAILFLVLAILAYLLFWGL